MRSLLLCIVVGSLLGSVGCASAPPLRCASAGGVCTGRPVQVATRAAADAPRAPNVSRPPVPDDASETAPAPTFHPTEVRGE